MNVSGWNVDMAKEVFVHEGVIRLWMRCRKANVFVLYVFMSLSLLELTYLEVQVLKVTGSLMYRNSAKPPHCE